MARKLVFHIGSFKSGSTAIQATLASKSYDCPGITVLYPGMSAREGVEKTRGQHGRVANTLLPGGLKSGEENSRLSKISENMKAIEADITVISAEKFEWVNPEVLYARIREYFPDYLDHLQIIFYVRPHAERLLSGYAERVKHGLFLGSLEEFHRKTRELRRPGQRGFFYHPRLMKWREVFGDSLTVRPMIRAQLLQSDVVADFFDQILDGHPFSIEPAKASNTSPSVEDLSVVKYFHTVAKESDVPAAAHEKFGLKLLRALRKQGSSGGTKLALHEELAKEAIETYEEDAAALDRDFFSDRLMETALRDVLEKSVPHRMSVDAADILDRAAMRQVAAWARTSAESLAKAKPGRQPKAGRK